MSKTTKNRGLLVRIPQGDDIAKRLADYAKKGGLLKSKVYLDALKIGLATLEAKEKNE